MALPEIVFVFTNTVQEDRLAIYLELTPPLNLAETDLDGHLIFHDRHAVILQVGALELAGQAIQERILGCPMRYLLFDRNGLTDYRTLLGLQVETLSLLCQFLLCTLQGCECGLETELPFLLRQVVDDLRLDKERISSGIAPSVNAKGGNLQARHLLQLDRSEQYQRLAAFAESPLAAATATHPRQVGDVGRMFTNDA